MKFSGHQCVFLSKETDVPNQANKPGGGAVHNHNHEFKQLSTDVLTHALSYGRKTVSFLVYQDAFL